VRRDALTRDEEHILGLLGARRGSASPRDLRETSGLPARTLTRALAGLERKCLLARRSKRRVELAAAGWLLLYMAPHEPVLAELESRQDASEPEGLWAGLREGFAGA